MTDKTEIDELISMVNYRLSWLDDKRWTDIPEFTLEKIRKYLEEIRDGVYVKKERKGK